MGQELSTTSYALLGLLVFSGPDAPGMTGYELKQRADRTLRFYWVSPAMSQVYSELARLADDGLVTVAFDGPAGRRDRRYRISRGRPAATAGLAGGVDARSSRSSSTRWPSGC